MAAATNSATSLAATMAQAQTLLAGLQGAAGGGGTTAPGTNAATGTPAANTGAAGTPAATTSTTAPRGSITPTGKLEMQSVNGVTKYYNALGKEITAFQYTQAHTFKVNLDPREGISVGISNLSKTLAARQERVHMLSNALANDANTTGSFNPADLQMMSSETTTTQQLSELEKKIFDSMSQSIQAWLR